MTIPEIEVTGGVRREHSGKTHKHRSPTRGPKKSGKSRMNTRQRMLNKLRKALARKSRTRSMHSR